MTSTDLPLATNRRLWRRTAWIVGAGLVVGAVLGAVPISHSEGSLGIVAMMLTLGGFAGSVSLLPSLIGRSDELRLPLLGLDRQARRSIRRTVYGRSSSDPSDSSPDERRRALDYADTFRLNQPVILAQSGLLYVGLVGAQLLSHGHQDAWDVWVRWIYLTAVPVFFVVAATLTIVRVRRATAYESRELQLNPANNPEN